MCLSVRSNLFIVFIIRVLTRGHDPLLDYNIEDSIYKNQNN